ncbi:MAG: isoprenylcysteine carboxylmethyltransferase family protein [Devosia sp.]
MSATFAMLLLWVGWQGAWRLAARMTKRSAARPPIAEERLYWLLLVTGPTLLLLGAVRPYTQWAVIWLPPPAFEWACVLLAALGFAFTFWARAHLGLLWSDNVARKADHRVVDTGPYGLVRHPIYTGCLVAALATLLLRPGLFTLSGFVLFALGFYIKARMEERFLGETLGPEYAAYRGRVPMLVPFWPRG